MSNKTALIIIVILIIINVLLGYSWYSSQKEKPVVDTVYIQPDTTRLFLKRSAIKEKIDTVYIEIEALSEVYEKMYNIILNESVDSDYIFFTRYTARYDSTQIE